MEVEREEKITENHEPMEVDDIPVSKKEKVKASDKEKVKVTGIEKVKVTDNEKVKVVEKEKVKDTEKLSVKKDLCNGQNPSEDENSSQESRTTKVNGKQDKCKETNGIKDSEEENSKDSKSNSPDHSEKSETSNGKDGDRKEDAEHQEKAEVKKKNEVQSEKDSKETNGEKEPVKEEGKQKEGEGKQKEDNGKPKGGEGKPKEDAPKSEEEKKKEQEDKKQEEKREKVKMFDHLGKDTEDMRPMAGLLYSIGADLAKQHIFKDLLRVQTKKKAKNQFQGQSDEDQLEHLKKSMDELVEKNKRFSSKQETCSKCQFRTESKNIMEWHLEFAHGTENNIYQCCFCEYYSKYPADFFFHVEQEHKRKGRIYMKQAFFACPLCPFEHNSKAALTKHRPKCEKNFNLKRNLEPSPTDCDIPLKKLKQPAQKVVKVTQPAKPVVLQKATVAQASSASWATRSAALASVRMPVTVQSMFGGQLPMPTLPVIQQRPVQPVVSQYTIGNNVFTLVNSQGQFMLHQTGGPGGITKTSGVGMVAPTNLATAGNMVGLQVPLASAPSAANQKSLLTSQSKSLIASQAAAIAAAAVKNTVKASKGKTSPQSNQNKSGQFEICEICGGFVKDRESLRIHFYWAHKVDINKELFDRKTPHLICEYCPSRFWTYQGYTRHRQMSHKVTSKEPAWKCPVCREDNITNLLTHLNQKHNISLNMICHQKYCPMCGLTFKNEVSTKQHLFSAHKQMFEKAVAASLASPTKTSPSAANPVPTGLFKHSPKAFEPVCSICDMTFPTVEAFSMHCARMHVFRCYRCGQKWNTAELLQAHFRQAHSNEQEKCQLCSSKLTIGRPYLRHLKRTHIKDFSVVVTRLSKGKFEHYYKKYLEKQQVTKDKKDVNESPVKGSKIVARKKTAGRSEAVIIDLSDDETKKKTKSDGDEKKSDSQEQVDGKKTTEVELEDSVTMEIDGETIVIQKDDDDGEEQQGDEKSEETLQGKDKECDAKKELKTGDIEDASKTADTANSSHDSVDSESRDKAQSSEANS